MPTMTDFWSSLRRLMDRAAIACDHAEFLPLVVTSSILHIAARRIVRSPNEAARTHPWCVIGMLLYFYHRFVTYPDDYADNIGRSLLVGWLLFGPMLLLRWIVEEVLVRCIYAVRRFSHGSLRTATRLFAAAQMAQQGRGGSIDPAPITHPTTVKAAKQAYQVQCNLIRTAGLSSEEEESLLLFAKQQYLQQLREIIE